MVEQALVERSESVPVRDFDRIARIIDRRLIMLVLGVSADEIKELPLRGLDGRPWIVGSTIEVTLLLEKGASLKPG